MSTCLFLNKMVRSIVFIWLSTHVKCFSICNFNTIRCRCVCVCMGEFSISHIFIFSCAHTLTTEFNNFLIENTHISPFTASDFGLYSQSFRIRCDDDDDDDERFDLSSVRVNSNNKFILQNT